MTETTGIETLDRLDVLRAAADDAIVTEFSARGRESQQPKAVDDWLAELSAAYPELRALVLQYRESRDVQEQIATGYQREALKILRERDALLEALKAYAPEDAMAGLHRDPDRCNPECRHCVVHGCFEDEVVHGDCGESDECWYRLVPHCDVDCPYPLARTVIANVEASE